MCGIAGFFQNVEATPDHLNQATALLSHRGPDDAGLYFDHQAKVGLGHTRLAILDLSPLGHQPMASDDGRVVLVFNGEIYNFQELRGQLDSLQPQPWRGHSDTEVLLRLYLHHRHSGQPLSTLLRQLNGIFAFVSKIKALLPPPFVLYC